MLLNLRRRDRMRNYNSNGNIIISGGGYGSAIRLKGSQTAPIQEAILCDYDIDTYQGKKAYISDKAYSSVSVKTKADACMNKM
ncbi:hypothetical protein SAMN05421503_2062 [Terribacillus aidingensis]|uniref:Uncharacterized protein n=2 Tax=Terribacillus aidingensis TaxID=586416 RepID=A0A285NPQ0_9BACI|nr:hypothetical protein SAMN05421503_2062 [Terribacillus aidingensis]